MKYLILLTLVFAGGLLACSREGSDQSVNAEAVVAQLSLRLPNETRIVGASASSEGDGLIRAKLEMPQAQVAEFVANANIQDLEQADPDLLGPDEGFWDPHRAGLIRYGQTALSGSRFLHVAVDDSRPDASVVYVMVHGT